MEKPKTILYLDLDGVLACFNRSPMFRRQDWPLHPSPPRMYEEKFFETLPPVDGSLSAVRRILQCGKYDIHILSQPVKETPHSYSEKAAWIAKWFPELSGKVTLTQNKEFLAAPGRVLVDDNAKKWKESWEAGGGIFMHFEYAPHDNGNLTSWLYMAEQLINMEGV